METRRPAVDGARQRVVRRRGQGRRCFPPSGRKSGSQYERPDLTWFAVHYEVGFAIPMMIGTCVAAASFALALVFGPETKGKVMVPDLIVA
jgi:hypothetical protein